MIRKLFFLAALLGVTFAVPAAQAGDTKMEVTLVWGTNDAKSPNPEHKDLEKELAEKLKKIFQWKNYFHVNRKETAVKDDGSFTKFKLSDDAAVEIKDLGDSKFEIKLYGKDKLVTTRTEKITKDDLTVIAGDVKNTDCAWFILIRQAK